MQSGKIVVQNLYKVFGQTPQEAINLLKEGWTKERLLKEKQTLVGVNNVSVSISEGEIFVLMGLSGSGKSTLIRMLNRLVDPSAGEILVDGQDIASFSDIQLRALRRRDMSMVFQSFALLPNRTALGNTLFGLEIAGKPRKLRKRLAMEMLEQVGLADFAYKYPHELSGGMRQRVGLARALAINPSIMIMDEAFSALDPLKRREMQDMVLELQRRHRRTIVFVSHDVEEALRIGNRIGIMQDGELIQTGTPEEIITRPANHYVRSFFDTVDAGRFIKAIDLAEPCELPLPPDCEIVPGDMPLQDIVQKILNGPRHLLVVRNDAGELCGIISENRLLQGLRGEHRA